MAKPDFIPQLDGLRGLCALAIVWAHFPQIGTTFLAEKFRGLPVKNGIDYLGVDIFFVLSGFLITRILINDKENRTPLRHFFIKRSLRIFPIYYASILFLAIWTASSAGYLGWCATYLSNYRFCLVPPSPPAFLNHSWSLCVEEHFYLAWPFLVYGLTPKKLDRSTRIWLPSFAIASSTALCFVLGTKGLDLVYTGTHARILSLAFGGTIAVHEMRVRHQMPLSRIWAMIFGGYLLMRANSLSAYFSAEIFLRLACYVGASIASAGIVIFFLRCPSSLASRILKGRLLRFSGTISYGMYLYHGIILGILGCAAPWPSRMIVTPTKAAIALALIFLVPTLSFHLLERPIQSLRNRLISNEGPALEQPSDLAPSIN